MKSFGAVKFEPFGPILETFSNTVVLSIARGLVGENTWLGIGIFICLVYSDFFRRMKRELQ